MQSNALLSSASSASSLDPTAMISTSSPPRSARPATGAARVVVLDDRRLLTSRRGTARGRRSACVERLRCRPASREADGAGAQRVLPVAVGVATHVDRDVARRGWCFRWSSTAEPSMTGSCRSRMIASGMYSWASARPASPRRATSPLKPRSRALPSSVCASSASSSTTSDHAVARQDRRRGRPRPRPAGRSERLAPVGRLRRLGRAAHLGQLTAELASAPPRSWRGVGAAPADRSRAGTA